MTMSVGDDAGGKEQGEDNVGDDDDDDRDDGGDGKELEEQHA